MPLTQQAAAKRGLGPVPPQLLLPRRVREREVGGARRGFKVALGELRARESQARPLSVCASADTCFAQLPRAVAS